MIWLVIGLGSYTKLAGYISDHPKVYEAEVHLRTRSTSDGAEREIV